MASAKQITDEMQQDPRFEIVAPTVFSLVCFRYRGTDEQNRVLLDAVNATHQALLSSTILNGRVVLRMAIGNIGTTLEDVRAVWTLLQDLAPR